MSGQSDDQPFSGAHPTTRAFVEQLTSWGFQQRRDDGVHAVFRGPHGGTLRVVRSLLGRADTSLVEKAARLAGVTVTQFWAGPERAAAEPNPPPETRRPASRRRQAAGDRITSLVLSIHATFDRPLGFAQVAELTGGRVSRDQVRAASSVLCRDGNLHRIRSGVYQWAGGVRAVPHASPSTAARELRLVHTPPAQPLSAESTTPRTASAQLFDQLFPSGIRMTAELLSDFEQWAKLTEKLVTHTNAS